MAMVIATLTGDKSVTPDKIADENLAAAIEMPTEQRGLRSQMYYQDMA